MQLYFAREWNKEGHLKVFKITENEMFYSNQLGSEQDIATLNTIRHTQKRLQFLVSRIAVQETIKKLGCTYHGIVKNNWKQAVLKNLPDWHVSISHSHEFIAIIIDRKIVGIDIEKAKNPKVLRTKSKFLNEEECFHTGININENIRYWCAKECLYKMYSHWGLSLKENILIRRVSKQTLEGEINSTQGNYKHKIYLKEISNYILAYVS